jgi:hypothetical protein
MKTRDIVEQISPRHAARLLKKGGLQPHRFRYWLTEVPDVQRDEKIREGCEVYAKAPERAMQGERTISMDELTGVQALERRHSDLPMASKWHVMLDNLNIHQSEALVCWVAQREGVEQKTLGVKGRSGFSDRWKAEPCFCMIRRTAWRCITLQNMRRG